MTTTGRSGLQAAGIVVLVGFAGGSSDAQVSKLFELTGSSKNDRFGRIAVLEDLDGDGVPDFAVGAPRQDAAAGAAAGAVYVYSGRTAGLLARWEGEAVRDTLGNSIAAVGDTNGDGVGDLAAAASSWLVDGTPQYVRVFSGKFIQDGTLPEILFDFRPSDVGDLGLTLAGAGDVDGDGCADLLIGCGTGLYEAYVVSGRSGAELFRATASGLSEFGLTVDGIADVDGDGFDDFLVGSYAESTPAASQAGVVWLYSGGPPGTIGTLLGEVRGDAAWDWFGMAVLAIGDVDGDAVEDFAVGASGQPDAAASIPGYVRLYSGATRKELATYHGDAAGEFFGWWIAAGDLDGDSLTDLVVSARVADDGRRRNTGRVVAYSGRDGSELFEFWGAAVGDRIGRLDASGDFDRDGRDDLLLGASLATVGGANDVGAVYLIPGSGCRASWVNYGTGVAGTLGVPRLEPDVVPALGAPIALTIGNSSGVHSSGVLLIGFDDASISTGFGGDVLVDWFALVPVCFTSGLDATLQEEVPVDTTLCGLHLYLQAIELDAGAIRGLSFSRGLELVLGGRPW